MQESCEECKAIRQAVREVICKSGRSAVRRVRITLHPSQHCERPREVCRAIRTMHLSQMIHRVINLFIPEAIQVAIHSTGLHPRPFAG